jgi:hypothetical protein
VAQEFPNNPWEGQPETARNIVLYRQTLCASECTIAPTFSSTNRNFIDFRMKESALILLSSALVNSGCHKAR